MTNADLPADLGAIITTVAPHILMFDAGRYLIAAGGMAAIVALLRWRGWSRDIQTRRAQPADYSRELLTSFRTVLVFVAVSVGIIWGRRNGYFPEAAADGGLAMTVLLVAMLLLWHDTWFYWTHRAMHDRRIFPWMHRTHHRSVAPTPFAAYAFSTSEAFVQTAFLPLWLPVVPTPLDATFIFLVIMTIRNVMGHAGVELHGRGWVDHPVLQWINTTVHHDLHHSGGFGSNYGLYFTWWDRLCGTEHRDYRARFRDLTRGRAVADADVASSGSASPPLGHRESQRLVLPPCRISTGRISCPPTITYELSRPSCTRRSPSSSPCDRP